jgi:hypothetical protein
MPDAGSRQGDGTSVVLSLPSGVAGELQIGAGAVASLNVWQNGALKVDNASAVTGVIRVALSQPGGGTIGTYDLMFGPTEVQGMFVAPECNICGPVP